MDADPVDGWPFGRLRLHLPARSLELRPASDADALVMGALVHDLLPAHERHFTPGLSALVGTTREETARAFRQRTRANRDDLRAERWVVPFAVVLDGEVIGMQSVMADDFPTERTVRTGSFLAAGARRAGVGTAMRAAVIELCFEVLGARRMLSGYLAGNDASRRVSERLGYVDDGAEPQEFEGVVRTKLALSLTPGRWASHRPAWLDGLVIEGAERAAGVLTGRDPCG